MAHTLRPTPLAALDSFPRALHELNRRLFGDPADEDALRPAAKLYLAAVTLAALGAALLAVGHATAPEPEGFVLALALAGAMTLAGIFPLPFIAKTKLALDTAALVAAVLLFEPGVAMLIGASGMVLADLVRRQPWDQALFNGAQVVVVTGTTSGLLLAAGWRADHLGPDRPGSLLVAVAAGVGLVVLSTAVVGPIVALQSATPLPNVWAGLLFGGGRRQLCTQLSEVGLGMLVAACVVGAVWWPLALLLVPAGPLYQVLARHLPPRRGPAVDAAPGA